MTGSDVLYMASGLATVIAIVRLCINLDDVIAKRELSIPGILSNVVVVILGPTTILLLRHTSGQYVLGLFEGIAALACLGFFVMEMGTLFTGKAFVQLEPIVMCFMITVPAAATLVLGYEALARFQLIAGAPLF